MWIKYKNRAKSDSSHLNSSSNGNCVNMKGLFGKKEREGLALFVHDWQKCFKY